MRGDKKLDKRFINALEVCGCHTVYTPHCLTPRNTSLALRQYDAQQTISLYFSPRHDIVVSLH